MRKNKTGGRRHFTQIILEPKTRDNKPNPLAGKVKHIKHQLVPKEPLSANLWGMK